MVVTKVYRYARASFLYSSGGSQQRLYRGEGTGHVQRCVLTNSTEIPVAHMTGLSNDLQLLVYHLCNVSVFVFCI